MGKNAKFSVRTVVELKLHVRTKMGGTSVRTFRTAEDAAEHYTNETFIRWFWKRQQSGRHVTMYDRKRVETRLYRRALNVFQNYLPMAGEEK